MERPKINLSHIAEPPHKIDMVRDSSSLITISKRKGESCIQINIDTDIETLGVAVYILQEHYNQALYRKGIIEVDELIRSHVEDYKNNDRNNIHLIRKG